MKIAMSDPMSLSRSSDRALLLLLSLVTAVLAAYTAELHSKSTEQFQGAESVKVDTVVFPTSCSPQAQGHFVRGVTALHSFWYPLALDEFRESTRVDPNCMMGYWGEAMAHNHPIWGDPQETEVVRKVIENIKITPKLTARERAWLNAVRVLYGEGNRLARDKGYAAAMEKIYRDYPNDPEAALFYALALMGTVRSEDPAGAQTRWHAGEIVAAVYKENPYHPGAAHYLIHAYDDPAHAHLALDAARRYAEIAPQAPHALHMPSHIFLQLGMWPEAAASNEASWEASNQWIQQQNLPISERSYHSLRWLMYIYLQQGRYDKAKEQLTLMGESLAQFPQDDPRNLIFGTFTHAAMAAIFVVETERWEAAEQLLPKGGGIQAQTDSSSNPIQTNLAIVQTPAIFARALAAAVKNSPQAQKSITELQAIREKALGAPEPFIAEIGGMTEVQEWEIEAITAAAKNDFDKAMGMMQKATALEEAMPPPSGPPLVIKPSHELFGEILLRAGRPQEAVEQFAISLRRHPNRARSLLGAARAAAHSGDTQSAVKFYKQFEQQWRQADAQLPELGEARDYLKRADSGIVGKSLMSLNIVPSFGR
ncbi:tetratricopeptide repeat protein [Nitrosococcus wardiae]|uniref:Tetratricopeptide repeat protein n=1 Tax=Nitrosococcus wardiae TaxID=1814290 RepID=A0A4P7BZP4_9GAMM|nr:tetratricopeptide repeat protein [Nitrosococcus wardiae]QBQ54759.1 tetratricopeptide repeat protein [Nitrosococcus wardiae]